MVRTHILRGKILVYHYGSISSPVEWISSSIAVIVLLALPVISRERRFLLASDASDSTVNACLSVEIPKGVHLSFDRAPTSGNKIIFRVV